MRRAVLVGLLVGYLPLLILWTGEGNAGVVTDQMKQTVEGVIAVLTDPTLKSPGHEAERRSALRNIIQERFDFAEMAKRSLARHWRRLRPEEQDEFVKIFSDLLEKSYVSKLESYTNEQIEYVGELVDGDYAEVKTRVVTAQNEIPVDYRLLRNGDQWKVYDVVIEGVSLINNYRAQFNRIIGQSSYKRLVQKMKAKLAEDAQKP